MKDESSTLSQTAQRARMEIKMKKNVVKVLAGIMVIGLLTACGKEESTSGVDVNTGVQSEAVIDEPAEAPAEQQEASADEFQFEEQDGAMVLTKYNGTAASVTIPDSKDGKAVVAIGDRAFSQNESIEEVIIPDSVTEIREAAFKGCIKLISVVLGNATELIENEAFYKCSELNNLNLPNSVSEMGENCFGMTGLTSITIPSSLKVIPVLAFSATKIENLIIPSTVETIDERAFEGCKLLTKVEIQEGVVNSGDAAFGDDDALNNIIMPLSLVNINEYAFINSKSELTITAPAGSYAEQYAAEQDIAFQAQ